MKPCLDQLFKLINLFNNFLQRCSLEVMWMDLKIINIGGGGVGGGRICCFQYVNYYCSYRGFYNINISINIGRRFISDNLKQYWILGIGYF